MAEHEILAIAKTLRYELTGLQAKVTELIRMAALLEPPDPSKHLCETCGLRFKGERTLAEHRYVQHDGPEPQHWLEVEAKAELEPLAEDHPEDELAKRRTTR